MSIIKTCWNKSAIDLIFHINLQDRSRLWKVISPNIYNLSSHIQFELEDGNDFIDFLYENSICSDLINFLFVCCCTYVSSIYFQAVIDEAVIIKWICMCIDDLFIDDTFPVNIIFLSYLSNIFRCKNAIISLSCYYTRMFFSIPKETMNFPEIEYIDPYNYFDNYMMTVLTETLYLKDLKKPIKVARLFCYIVLMLTDRRNYISVDSTIFATATDIKSLDVLLSHPLVIISSNIYA